MQEKYNHELSSSKEKSAQSDGDLETDDESNDDLHCDDNNNNATHLMKLYSKDSCVFDEHTYLNKNTWAYYSHVKQSYLCKFSKTVYGEKTCSESKGKVLLRDCPG